MQHKAIIRDILEGRLLPAKEERLVNRMLQDPQHAGELLSQHRIDVALRAVFTPQNHSLEAAIMASITGTTDGRAGSRTITGTKPQAKCRKPFILRWVLPMSAAAAAVLGAGWYFNPPRAKAPVATLVTAVDAKWTGKRDPAVHGFTPGPWKLESGVAELRTSAGAIVTLQGPAEFIWRTAGLMELRSGLLQATVPAQASGFTVDTKAARIVDIGTRFGVRADSTHPTEVHVFEGHVRAEPGNGSPRSDLLAGDALAFTTDTGGSRRFAANPSLFPQSEIIRLNLLKHGGCEPGDPKRVSFAPSEFGTWGGDESEVLDEWNGATPHRGQGMLRLTHNVAGDWAESHGYVSNEQWQFINLAPHAKAIDSGHAVAEASMWIRQVGGQPVNFRLCLAGFNTGPSSIGPGLARTWHSRMTATSIAETMGDPEAPTWKQIRTRLELPAGTRIVYVNPRVVIGSQPDPDAGYLLDSIEFKLAIPPRPAAAK